MNLVRVAASRSHQILRTKLRLILDVATADTEMGWLMLAKRRGTRGINDAVRAFRLSNGSAPPTELDPGGTPEYERVSLRLNSEQLAAWHWGRAAGRVILGNDSPDWTILEAMAGSAAPIQPNPSCPRDLTSTRGPPWRSTG